MAYDISLSGSLSATIINDSESNNNFYFQNFNYWDGARHNYYIAANTTWTKSLNQSTNLIDVLLNITSSQVSFNFLMSEVASIGGIPTDPQDQMANLAALLIYLYP